MQTAAASDPWCQRCLSLATFLTSIVSNLVFALAPLYITDSVERGGLGLSIHEGFSLYGTWYGLSFVTPLIGGMLPSLGLTERTSLALGYFMSGIGLALFCANSTMLLNYAFFFHALGHGISRTMQTTLLHLVADPMRQHRKQAYRTLYLATALGFACAAFLGGYLYTRYSFHTLMYFLFILLGIAAIFLKYHPKGGASEEKQSQSNGNSRAFLYILIAGIPPFLGYAQLNTSMLYYLHNFVPRTVGNFEIPELWLSALASVCVLVWVSCVKPKHKLGDLRSIALATSISAVAFTTLAFVPLEHGLLSFGLGYLLVGAADLIIRPRLMHAVGVYVSTRRRSFMTGVVCAATGLSIKCGSRLAGYVATIGFSQFFGCIAFFCFSWAIVGLWLERRAQRLLVTEV